MKVLYYSLFIVLADQITKLFVKGISIPVLHINLAGMYPGEKLSIISDWFNITFIENPGIGFGIDFGNSLKPLMAIVTLAATAGLFIYMFYIKDKSFGMRLSVALIIGGAVGNFIDRAFYGLIYGYGPFLHGMVVDFVDIRIFNFFIFNKIIGNYIFNLADLSVTAGVILLLFSYSRQKEENPEVKKPAENILAENKE